MRLEWIRAERSLDRTRALLDAISDGHLIISMAIVANALIHKSIGSFINVIETKKQTIDSPSLRFTYSYVLSPFIT